MITVRTRVRNVRSGMVHFMYEVLRAEDKSLLAEGETIHFVVGDDGNKRSFPDKYMKLLRGALATGD